MICASEQAAIVDQEIYNDFMKEIKRFHVYFVNKEEKAKLENSCLVQKLIQTMLLKLN